MLRVLLEFTLFSQWFTNGALSLIAMHTSRLLLSFVSFSQKRITLLIAIPDNIRRAFHNQCFVYGLLKTPLMVSSMSVYLCGVDLFHKHFQDSCYHILL